jgi:anaerobic glycerol-3-phosphate dehydrogenase
VDESEAYWAGLVVAVIMLGSGFSLLLTPTYTGYGAVILSLGIMTMIVVLMTKALITQIQKWMDYNARIEETVANILTLRQQGIPAPAKTVVVPEKPRIRDSKREAREAEVEA